MPNLEGIIYIPDFMLKLSRNEELTAARERLNALYGERYPKYFRKEHVVYREAPNGEDLAMINYTSGTTSNSKGVLIPYRAVWSNYEFATEVLGDKVKPGDSIISMLPMAHMYGMAFEFLFEFLFGLHVHYLTSKPTPTIIVQAFAAVKPKVVISVPLIIEKIIKKMVMPKLETPSMKILLRLPIISDRILTKVKRLSNKYLVENSTKSSLGCGSQQRSGTIPSPHWLQLHRRLWCHRMCTHHHLRRLE